MESENVRELISFAELNRWDLTRGVEEVRSKFLYIARTWHLSEKPAKMKEILWQVFMALEVPISFKQFTDYMQVYI